MTIDKAAEALCIEIRMRNKGSGVVPAMTDVYLPSPAEIADIIKRELEKAVPVEPEDHDPWNAGWNECRKRIGLGE